MFLFFYNYIIFYYELYFYYEQYPGPHEHHFIIIFIMNSTPSPYEQYPRPRGAATHESAPILGALV